MKNDYVALFVISVKTQKKQRDEKEIDDDCILFTNPSAVDIGKSETNYSTCSDFSPDIEDIRGQSKVRISNSQDTNLKMLDNNISPYIENCEKNDHTNWSSFIDKSKIKSLYKYLKDLKQTSFFQDIGVEKYYMFTHKTSTFTFVFFLLVGKTVTLSGWSFDIKKRLENKINDFFEKDEKIHIMDCTYTDVKQSRRLRALGGGIRRIFSIIKENSKNKNNKLTNKQIIENLKHYTILGSEDELIRTIDAVERNKKLPNEIKEHYLNDSTLPFDKTFSIIRKIVISLTVIRLVYVIEYTIHIIQEKVERPAVDSLCYNFINELKSLLNLGDSEQYKSSINNL